MTTGKVSETVFKETIIYSKMNTFNLGRAVKTRTFRDYMIKKINDKGMDVYLTVEFTNNIISITKKIGGSQKTSHSSYYPYHQPPRELPKVCDYITTKVAVKLLKKM